MNYYERRLLKEKLYKEMKRSILTNSVASILENKTYEELNDFTAIKLCSIISQFYRLDNKFES